MVENVKHIMANSLPYRIVIVECYSSAVNYIHDLRVRSCEPILLERFVPEAEQAKVRSVNDAAYAFNGDLCPAVLIAKENYADTLEMIRALSPGLVLPGSDAGIELALRLSEDLHLKSNPFALFPAMRDKLTMQETLKAAGLRSIASHAVTSEDEALDFFRALGSGKAVLKPSRAAASSHVFICSSEAEIRRAYREVELFVRRRKNAAEKIVAQEYIDGEEYALDTVSCDGEHIALFGMKYRKRLCEGFGKIYDTDFYFSPSEESVRELVNYAFRVLDCLGVLYGPVHGEFMVDEKGPVLVEVNCRPAGAFQKYTFQDKVMYNHETAIALDAYFMEKEAFCAVYPKRMRLRQPAAVKHICLNEPMFVKRPKLTERLCSLASFNYAIEYGENRLYPKTTDLDTIAGMIYLTDPDAETVARDLETIDTLERTGRDELFDWCRA